jgi:O-antigen/teichoic acid export membrane protein
MAVALIGAAITGFLSLQTALFIAGAGTLTAALIGFGRAVQLAGGLRVRPRRALLTLPYALRAHGANVGSLLNARLDLLILPMLLGAGPIGLYSVAAGVSLIVPGLAGSVAYVLFPELARRRREGAGLVLRSALIALFGAAMVAIPLSFWAEEALTFVYGSGFAPSGGLLRILLLGAVLNAGAFVVATGLTARGFPGHAALAQVGGVIVTLVGLYTLVEQGGVVAAAWVSTFSYAFVFVAACLLYAQVSRPSRSVDPAAQ